MRRREASTRAARTAGTAGALVAALTIAWALLTPASASAAIAEVGASSANASSSSSEAISKPSGVASGQVLVATITASGTGAITPPAGWTQIQDTTTTFRQSSYYHVADTSEPSSWTWSLGSARYASGGIIAYSGVDTTVPVDASASSSGASGNAVTPPVTANFAGDQVIAAVGFTGSWFLFNSVTPGTGTTERYDSSTINMTESEAADFTQASAGATPTKTATPATGGAWIADTIALDPASAATLAVSTSATPSFAASLPAGDQTSTYTLPLGVQDTRTPTSAGWNLTITSTPFTSGAHALPTTASRATAATSTCVGGASCVSPSNSVAYPVAVPAGTTPPAAAKLYNAAAGTGSGVFSIIPTISVAVPANSYAGSYTSTVTVSIVSGP